MKCLKLFCHTYLGKDMSYILSLVRHDNVTCLLIMTNSPYIKSLWPPGENLTKLFFCCC